jgi:tRNA A-37 threonylcarbamoyl transferase component Bud32
VSEDGRLDGPSEHVARLAAAGLHTVADVLSRATQVRDLPERSNHLLRVAGHAYHVKREKRRRRAREAAGLVVAGRAGVPVARLAFHGTDRRLGALTGTVDLAPARPLDDLLREGLPRPQALAALRALAVAAAALHQARLHHHDLYLNHVFVDPRDPDARVTLIDLERLTSHHGILGRTVVKDLAAIESSIPEGLLTCHERARFLAGYLAARRFPVRTLLGPLLRRVVRKAARIRAHAPRTPV